MGEHTGRLCDNCGDVMLATSDDDRLCAVCRVAEDGSDATPPLASSNRGP